MINWIIRENPPYPHLQCSNLVFSEEVQDSIVGFMAITWLTLWFVFGKKSGTFNSSFILDSKHRGTLVLVEWFFRLVFLTVREVKMEALEAIRQRRNVRSFTGAPIPRSDLEKIVDSGRLAASGSNRQPWDFVVVTDRKVIACLKVAGPWIEKAGAVIAVVLDPYSHWWLQDGSAAVQNMLVSATALGYGACWFEGDILPMEDELKTLLGIPPGKRLMTLVPIGVPAEIPQVEKRPLENVLHWEKY